MNQYTPMYKALTHPKLKRKLTTFEYDKVVDYALDLGFQKLLYPTRQNSYN